MQYDRDKAVEAIGGSQFDLVMVASHRARELKKGAISTIETDNNEGIKALIEIQEGLFTKQDWLDTISGKRKVDFKDDESF